METYDIDRVIVNDILIKTKSQYVVYIQKTKYKMYVINREKEVLKVFSIAIGKNADLSRKVYEGDGATPEGLYYICEVLSLNAVKTSYAYNRLKQMNSLFFSAKNGHFLWGDPTKDAGYRVYGPRFFRLNYPNEDDIKYYNEMRQKGLLPKNANGHYKDIGAGLAIHGTNDPLSIGHKISTGCIRLNNEDVKQLDAYLQVGSPVYIEK